jgi:hypothetical protein
VIDLPKLLLTMLIAKGEDGSAGPVSAASTISEPKELAASGPGRTDAQTETRRGRRHLPVRYKLWARGVDGEYLVATTIGNYGTLA